MTVFFLVFCLDVGETAPRKKVAEVVYTVASEECLYEGNIGFHVGVIAAPAVVEIAEVFVVAVDEINLLNN
jgi:hypothetical protein